MITYENKIDNRLTIALIKFSGFVFARGIDAKNHFQGERKGKV